MATRIGRVPGRLIWAITKATIATPITKMPIDRHARAEGR
jgi:hypothetical protein